jgi:hypothetical protein
VSRRVFKAWSEYFRSTPDGWLLVHKQGDYQYRSPDSVYIHSFETFKTREEAVAYLDERIPRADRDEWTLWQAVSI